MNPLTCQDSLSSRISNRDVGSGKIKKEESNGTSGNRSRKSLRTRSSVAATTASNNQEKNDNPSLAEVAENQKDGIDTNKANADPIPTEDEGEARPALPLYSVLQKVYARDQDGMLYEAVIRRQLYCPDHSRPDNAPQGGEESSWHYFVHYNGWSVKWDRWIAEPDIFECNDRAQAYAKRLAQEFSALKEQLSRHIKGKKKFQTIDPAQFAREWGKKRAMVDVAMKMRNPVVDLKKELAHDDGSNKKDNSKKNTWTKTSVAHELKLREKSQTRKRKPQHAGMIPLPLTLKKVVVEQWEIICQCAMLPCLPSAPTVRQALDLYVQSKIGPSHEGSTADEPVQALDSVSIDAERASSGKKNETMVSPKDNHEAIDKLKDDKRAADWVRMANGIAMLFDEALPSQLLYREEVEQYNHVISLPEFANLLPSMIYGCEYLLRLLVKLPEILSEEMEESEMRTVVAKVNDFVRFLQKHQADLLTQRHQRARDFADKIKPERRKRGRPPMGFNQSRNDVKKAKPADDVLAN